MCFLIKQCPEDTNKPPNCPFLVSFLTGSFRNHIVYDWQPCHSPSQAWCRYGPADHQPPVLWARSGWRSPPLHTTRCFVRVTYWGKRDFPEDSKSALISGHLSAKSPSHPFPGWLHTSSTHNSAPHTTRSLLPGVQLSCALCFKEPPKRAGLRLFWNLGIHVAVLRKQPGLPSVNSVLLCCEHIGSALCWRIRSCFTHLGISSRKSGLQ